MPKSFISSNEWSNISTSLNQWLVIQQTTTNNYWIIILVLQWVYLVHIIKLTRELCTSLHCFTLNRNMYVHIVTRYGCDFSVIKIFNLLEYTFTQMDLFFTMNQKLPLFSQNLKMTYPKWFLVTSMPVLLQILCFLIMKETHSHTVKNHTVQWFQMVTD